MLDNFRSERIWASKVGLNDLQIIRWKRSYGSKFMAVWSLGVKLSKPQRGNRNSKQTATKVNRSSQTKQTTVVNKVKPQKETQTADHTNLNKLKPQD